jgi:energy-coupling factor transport system ATP-binding protein
LISFKNVSFGYRAAENPVISRATFELVAGEFALVCGPTGSGKSTLLKLVNGLAPSFTGGVVSGAIFIANQLVSGRKPNELAELVGFVNQQPEGSFVADTVGEELAYGLEQLGFSNSDMEERIQKFAEATGIAALLERPLASLSGGQQQRVAIAAALVAGQKVLVLDEPTSALDSRSAADLIKLLAKLSKELQITVLLAEHRLERVLDKIDSVIVVNGDSSVVKSRPAEAFKDYRLTPPVVELSKRLNLKPLALSVAEARSRFPKAITFEPISSPPTGEIALEAKELTIDYGTTKAVDGVSIAVNKGEVVALMGANGSGKSSLLWALQGSGKRTSGTVWTPFGDPSLLDVHERLCAITLVPQRASDLLFLNSLAAELEESDKFNGVSTGETAKLFLELTSRTDPKQHPRDLSAGQQLALVLAVQLVKGAPIVLLDEPTRGLDYEAKRHLAKAIEIVRDSGRSVLIASHDVEFVAQLSSRVFLLETGRVIFEGSTRDALGPDGPLPTQVAAITNQAGLLLATQVGDSGAR